MKEQPSPATVIPSRTYRLSAIAVIALRKMKIHFPIDWDEQYNLERPAKGWLSDVKVIFDTGRGVELTFYDPTRLAQDLEEEIKLGKSGIIEKGLMVIPSVTKENIEKAIKQAATEGYFEQEKL